MATTGRTENSALERSPIYQALEREPWRFEFFQAVRLLQLLEAGREPVGRFSNPSSEVVRFGVNPSPAFPASQLQSFTRREDGTPRIAVNFMGLIGPLGLLPLYYTQLVLERIRSKDSTLADFFDIFHHRIISLFYAAWEKYHFNVAYERGELDRFSHHLLDLLGLGTTGLQDRQEISDDSLLFYSGLLSLHTRPALALRNILWDYFDVPVEIEQFVGAWYPVDAESLCELGSGERYSEQLGVGAVAGSEVWDQQSRVRIKLGPLRLDEYRGFLPGGDRDRQLRAITGFFAGGKFDVELQLILHRDEVPPCELEARDGEGWQLGWTSWIKSAPFGYDPGDTVLNV